MNPADIDFDLITPNVITRPEKCMVCDTDPDLYFGRLNFRQPGASAWPIQHCPMHKKDIADGKVTMKQTILVPTNEAAACAG